MALPSFPSRTLVPVARGDDSHQYLWSEKAFHLVHCLWWACVEGTSCLGTDRPRADHLLLRGWLACGVWFCCCSNVLCLMGCWVGRGVLCGARVLVPQVTLCQVLVSVVCSPYLCRVGVGRC